MDGCQEIRPGSRSGMIRPLGLKPPNLRLRGEERQVQRVAVIKTASSGDNQIGELPATSTTLGP